MKYDPDMQDLLNRKHSLNPQVGDYWHECFSPAGVVVGVTSVYVLVLEKSKSTDENHWTWDLEVAPNCYTRKEYEFRWTYGRIGNPEYRGEPNYPVSDKCWCCVIPEAHKWVAEELAA